MALELWFPANIVEANNWRHQVIYKMPCKTQATNVCKYKLPIDLNMDQEKAQSSNVSAQIL